MSERIEFTSRSGRPAAGVIAEPAGAARVGAVVLIQEWWGLNDHIRSLVDRLATAGFVVLAPDLYHGKVTTSAEEAGKLMGALDFAAAVDEVAGAVAFLAGHARSNGKVGVTGFCLGGALTFATAIHVPQVAAAVPFYGIPDVDAAEWAKVRAPIQAHFAAHDDWAKPAGAEAVRAELAKHGKTMELFVYDAQHAFVNDTRPEVHDAAAARQAWDRMVEFFRRHLGA